MTLDAWAVASPDAVLLVGDDGRVRIANAAAARLLGSDPAGRPLEELVGAAIAARVRSADAPGFLEARLAGDGRVVEVAVTRVPGTTSLRLRDLGPDHELEIELTRLASFAEMSVTPMFEVGADGAISWANPAARRLLSAPDAADLPARLSALHGSSDRHSRSEARIGDRWYELDAQVIPAWRCVRVLAIDVTSAHSAREHLERRVRERTVDLAEANEALEETIEQLRRAEADAHAASRAKSMFLANMSHELRTPLNAIIGYAELLDDGATPEVKLDLGRIRGAARHLLDIVSDILDLSKIEAGRIELRFEPLEVDGLVQEVADTLRGLVEANGSALEIRTEGPGVVVYSDRARLRQILVNLLGNAAKFTERGRVTLAVRREADELRFDVTDTGIGIAPERIAQLFEPFVQGDGGSTRKYGGTGLGLAICREFSRLLGGEIAVESELGRGSTFTLRVPLGAPDPADAGDGPRVLVIDDDPVVRDLLSRQLVPQGYRVECAAGGDEGLRLALARPPDVITLDLLMPGRDGWSVLRELESHPATACVPVVLLSILADTQRGYGLGAAAHLVKPVDRTTLVETLRRVTGGERRATVLVVDDDLDARDTMRRSLLREGWIVRVAEDGVAALELMARELPSAVVLDLMMPRLDGFELVERMRADPRLAEVPVVVLSAMTLGPEDRARLDGRVRTVLEKGAHDLAFVRTEVARLVR